MAQYGYDVKILVTGGTVQTAAAIAAAIDTAITTLTGGNVDVQATSSSSGMDISISKTQSST